MHATSTNTAVVAVVSLGMACVWRRGGKVVRSRDRGLDEMGEV